jgi:hypothetical protein
MAIVACQILVDDKFAEDVKKNFEEDEWSEIKVANQITRYDNRNIDSKSKNYLLPVWDF